ncbi:hypothetical protein As57867_018953, partial [Aphanomyces stellatus]
DGANLFWFNRIVGFIWVGRPLLFVRGVTAVLVLSTTQLALVEPIAGHSRFAFAPRSVLASMVLAGEATWLLYVSQDFLTIALNRFTKVYGPISCLAAWVALVALELASPVLPIATLDRHCTAHDMDNSVQCVSGVLQIGNLARFVEIFAVMGAAMLAALVLGHVGVLMCFRRRDDEIPTRHLLGVADLYVASEAGQAERWTLDKVSCLMAGLVSLAWGHHSFTFDIKLWVLLRDKGRTASTKIFAHHSRRRTSLQTLAIQVVVSEQQPTNAMLDTTPKSMTWQHLLPRRHVQVLAVATRAWKRMVPAFGVFYALSSIAGSVSYLHLSQVNLANDLFWANFNTTGTHAFIATWLNKQLLLGIHDGTTTKLTTASINVDGPFAVSPAILTPAANYGAQLQFSELNGVDETIRGLRLSDGCTAPWIFTQYCYVDFQQQWQLANSAARQRRCQAMTANGAVFLESILRNIPFADFYSCWGPAYESAIAHDLRQSTPGQMWLAAIASSADKLPVVDEIALWQSYHITRFETQWQNFKRIGLVNQYSVWNAYGTAYPFSLQYQNASFRLSQQTSYIMYWGLANDFMAVMPNSTSGIGGQSLIRSSPHFAFANMTISDVLVQNSTLSLPLANVYTIMTNEVGPFGSIDMRFVPCPLEAKEAMRNILSILRSVLAQSNETQSVYHDINTPTSSMLPVPKAWSDVNFQALGGSPLCPEVPFGSGMPITLGIGSLMSWDRQCASVFLVANSGATKEYMIVAAVLAQLSHASPDAIAQTCGRIPSNVGICTTFLTETVAFVATYLSPQLQTQGTTANDAKRDRGGAGAQHQPGSIWPTGRCVARDALPDQCPRPN